MYVEVARAAADDVATLVAPHAVTFSPAQLVSARGSAAAWRQDVRLVDERYPSHNASRARVMPTYSSRLIRSARSR